MKIQITEDQLRSIVERVIQGTLENNTSNAPTLKTPVTRQKNPPPAQKPSPAATPKPPASRQTLAPTPKAPASRQTLAPTPKAPASRQTNPPPSPKPDPIPAPISTPKATASRQTLAPTPKAPLSRQKNPPPSPKPDPITAPLAISQESDPTQKTIPDNTSSKTSPKSPKHIAPKTQPEHEPTYSDNLQFAIISNLQASLLAYQQKSEALEATNNALQQQVIELQAKLQKLEKANAALTTQCQTLREQVNQAYEESKDIVDNINVTHQLEIAQLQKQLIEIQEQNNPTPELLAPARDHTKVHILGFRIIQSIQRIPSSSGKEHVYLKWYAMDKHNTKIYLGKTFDLSAFKTKIIAWLQAHELPIPEESEPNG